jgi:eukaryotic-like serine/threonine-protein kinase
VPGGHEVPAHSLRRAGAAGTLEALPPPPRPYMNLSPSPDGRAAAVTIHQGAGSDVWRADLERGTLARLTHRGHNIEPLWSPDGGRIAFASSRTGPYNLFAVPADGSGPAVRLLAGERNQYPNAWSPDGRLLAFTTLDPETGADLWVLPTAGEGGPPRELLRTRFNEDRAAFSPDGRFFAYESDESGRFEVYVRPFPAGSPRWPVSVDGGSFPFWSPDGRQLDYLSGDALLSVDVETAGAFRAGTPRKRLDAAEIVAYRPSARGLIAVQGTGRSPTTARVNVVLGWFAELRALAG